MTAKEALRDYIEGLTEDDAAELLQFIEWRDSADDCSADDLARIAEGRTDIVDGRVRTHASVVADARALHER